MSASAAETPEQIEERLAAQRRALSSTVDELAARVDPRVQAREAGVELRARAQERADDLRSRLDDLRDRARDTLERAQDGDSEAIGIVAAVAGGAVAAGLVLGRLIARR